MTAFLDAVLNGRDTVSDAADRRIAELEQRVKELGWENDNLRKSREVLGKQSAELHDRDLRHIESLRKQLVERDVYEAQQILPPEQAALIKHLATVERCIEEGPVNYHHAEESDCSFCYERQGHLKDCAWLALQFDRKPAETMALVEGWAWEENDSRDRTRARAIVSAGLRRLQGPALTMMGLNEMLNVATRVASLVERVPEGSRIVSMTHDSMTVDVPVTAVAPPDDEDVP